MKQFLLAATLFITLGISHAFGQYGVLISPMIPTGNYYPYLLKPGIGAEVDLGIGDIDDRYRIALGIGYYVFHSTQDTFNTYGVGSGLSSTLYPGYEVIHSYSMLQLGLTNNFRILPKGKLSPVAGLDLFMDVFDISEDDYTETVSQSSSTNDTYYNWAIVPRIGVQYDLNSQLLLSAGLGRSMGFLGDIGRQPFWKPYISIIYFTK